MNFQSTFRYFESGVSPLRYRKAQNLCYRVLFRCRISQMSFAILRIQKLKSFADVGGSLSHNYRNRETLNADDARTHLNEHELDTNEKCMTAIRDRIPEKDVKMLFYVLSI